MEEGKKKEDGEEEEEKEEEKEEKVDEVKVTKFVAKKGMEEDEKQDYETYRSPKLEGKKECSCKKDDKEKEEVDEEKVPFISKLQWKKDPKTGKWITVDGKYELTQKEVKEDSALRCTKDYCLGKRTGE